MGNINYKTKNPKLDLEMLKYRINKGLALNRYKREKENIFRYVDSSRNYEKR